MFLGAGEPAERTDLLEADEARCSRGGRSIVRQRDLLSVSCSHAYLLNILSISRSHAYLLNMFGLLRQAHDVLCEERFSIEALGTLKRDRFFLFHNPQCSPFVKSVVPVTKT